MITTLLVALTGLIALIALFVIVPLRRALVSSMVMKIVGRILPTMGETERIALEAGTVGWEGQIFSGRPDWSKLHDFKIQELSPDEQAFLDGPVEQLCTMVDDFQLAQDRDLPPETWDFIKKERFFGIIIPKKYGGLGFSAHAHSAVVAKISSRSVATAVTVMVPNSLGPGELLMEYGTEAQKDHYLPRLAVGTDVPCFALTEPNAGSDAANGQSQGIICKGEWAGEDIIGIRMTFNKRYITLAPIATVLGIAFRLLDPDGLIGDKKDIGITCALLPRETPGVVIGNRHDPMGVPFHNGPISGTDVFVPLDYIIGGIAEAGNGWRMLMENLAAGRCISLPSLSVGAAQLSTRATTAYGIVREQFGLPIGRFEGVRERIARIAGHTYFMNATRRLSFGAIDAGERPSVLSAIAKAYLTEGMRVCLNDAMDIHAGSAISRGPNNIFSRSYISIPIGITVEGANILTRSLIVFGQGAIRCHPFVAKEMHAIADQNLNAFDEAFFGHVGHIFKTALRTFGHGISGGRFAASPVVGFEAKYYQDISRFSAIFALTADVALGTLGGALKRKEHLSGRFADAFSWMFLATAALKDFHDKGRPNHHRAYLEWTCTHALYQVEQALIGVLDNLPYPAIAWTVKQIAFPFGAKRKPLTDAQIEAVAESALFDEQARLSITGDIFIPKADQPGLGILEATLKEIHATEAPRKKVGAAKKAGKVDKGTPTNMAKQAFDLGIITEEEFESLVKVELMRDQVIQVADFSPEAYGALK